MYAAVERSMFPAYGVNISLWFKNWAETAFVDKYQETSFDC